MRLLLIGHSVEDHIFFKGEEIIKPGGLFYTASGMLAIKNEEDEIFLITSIDNNIYKLFSNVYDKLNTAFSTIGEGVVPRVNLYLHDDKERDDQFDRTCIKLKIP